MNAEPAKDPADLNYGMNYSEERMRADVAARQAARGESLHQKPASRLGLLPGEKSRTGNRIEVDYAQIAAQVGATGGRGRDVEKAVKDAIKHLARRFPSQRVVLINRPGSVITVAGGRRYLVMKSGELVQLSGEVLHIHAQRIV